MTLLLPGISRRTQKLFAFPEAVVVKLLGVHTEDWNQP